MNQTQLLVIALRKFVIALDSHCPNHLRFLHNYASSELARLDANGPGELADLLFRVAGMALRFCSPEVREIVNELRKDLRGSFGCGMKEREK